MLLNVCPPPILSSTNERSANERCVGWRIESVWLFTSLFPLLSSPHLAHNIIDMLIVLSPALALSSLFIASTTLTEGISSGKYEAYGAYQKRVGMFWPTGTAVKAAWMRVWGGKKEAERVIWGEELKKKEE